MFYKNVRNNVPSSDKVSFPRTPEYLGSLQFQKSKLIKHPTVLPVSK